MALQKQLQMFLSMEKDAQFHPFQRNTNQKNNDVPYFTCHIDEFQKSDNNLYQHGAKKQVTHIHGWWDSRLKQTI